MFVFDLLIVSRLLVVLYTLDILCGFVVVKVFGGSAALADLVVVLVEWMGGFMFGSGLGVVRFVMSVACGVCCGFCMVWF